MAGSEGVTQTSAKAQRIASSPGGGSVGGAGFAGVLISIALAAAAARGAFVLRSPDRNWSHSVYYEGDAPLWVRYADCLRAERPFEFDIPVHPPGMGYVLAWLLPASSGGDFLPLKVGWAIVGSLTCVLAAVVARPVLGARAAVMTGLLCAASFGLIVQSTSLNNEALYAPLLLFAIDLTRRVAHRPRWWTAVALGVVHGAAALLRPEHVAAAGLLSAWLMARRSGAATFGESAREGPRRAGRPGVRPALISLIVFVLVPLPWNVRSFRAIQRFNMIEPATPDYERPGANWTGDAIARMRELPAFARDGTSRHIAELARSVGQATIDRAFVDRFFDELMGYRPRPISPWTFVSNQGALSFALANHALADGGFSLRPLEAESPGAFSFANPRHLRLFQEGYAIGLRHVLSDWDDAARLMAAKLRRFVDGLRLGFGDRNLPFGVEGVRWPVDQLTVRTSGSASWGGVVVVLACVGAWVARARFGAALFVLVIAYKLLVTVAFYGYARQAVTVLPVVFALASAGLEGVLVAPLLRGAACPRRWEMAGLVVLAAGCMLMAVLPWRAAYRYDVSGSAEAAPRMGRGAFESAQPLAVRLKE